MKAERRTRLLWFASFAACAADSFACSSEPLAALAASRTRRSCSVSAATMAETAASTHSITVWSSVESSLYAAARASTSRNMP